jgi:hypothetical protein
LIIGENTDFLILTGWLKLSLYGRNRTISLKPESYPLWLGWWYIYRDDFFLVIYLIFLWREIDNFLLFYFLTRIILVYRNKFNVELYFPFYFIFYFFIFIFFIFLAFVSTQNSKKKSSSNNRLYTTYFRRDRIPVRLLDRCTVWWTLRQKWWKVCYFCQVRVIVI